MIDIESKVVDTIYNAVITDYPDADVTTGFDVQKAIFPCVVVEEIDNVPYRRTSTDDCAENHAQIVYQVTVYTDNEGNAKTTGKAILGIVDDALQTLKFRKFYSSKPMNIARTIFWQYARWEVIVSKPITKIETVGNETVVTDVYQMYRR